MIDQHKLDELIDRVDLPAFIERETKVIPRKAGGEYRSTCPLHKGDNTSAFSVYQNGSGVRWLYYCHTKCHTGGDALRFIRAWRNLDFVDAVRELCRYTNTTFESLGMTEQSIAEYKEREQRRDVMDVAAKFFHAQFNESEIAKGYMAARGFSNETMNTATFGFSLGCDTLLKHLKKENADVKIAMQLGLVRSDGHDFTANGNGREVSPDGWIVYVHRVGGRVDYLSARAIHPLDPKDKSRNLPGEKKIYRADVRGDNGLIIVEGQANAESWRQLGFSSWALCGTKLSGDDAAAIRQHTPVYLQLDHDLEGARRLVPIAKAIAPLTMVVPDLPDNNNDMNDWLKNATVLTRKVVDEYLRRSKPFIDGFIKSSQSIPEYEADERIGEVAQMIALLPDTLQGKYIKKASSAFDIPAADIKRRMKQTDDGDDDYCYSEIRNGMMTFRKEPLCNLSFTISHQLTMDNGQDAPQVKYTLDSKMADGKTLGSVTIDAEEFEEPRRWMPRNWGADAIIMVPPSQSYLIARAAKEISRKIGLKRETVHTYTGFANVNGEQVFMSANGAIKKDGHDQTVRVELGQNRLAFYELPPAPTETDKAKRAMKWSLEYLSLAPRTVTAPIWCAMYGSVLTSVFPLNAVLWVYGPTQSGKSTITALALSHFGEKFIKGRDYFAPKDWVSTITDLEGAMFTLKDMPLLIDDFAPQFTGHADSVAMHKKAHAVVRSVGNRSSRGRANADLSERAQRPPRGLVVSTAELPLIGQSVVGRMIYVPVERGDVPFRVAEGERDMVSDAQRAAGPGSGVYAQAMSGYIQWLIANWDEQIANARADHERANQYARTIFPSTQSRMMDYYANLVMYGRCALRYAVHCGAAHPDMAREYGETIIPAALADVLTKQAQRVSGQSPVIRLFEAIADLLMSRRAHIMSRTGSQTNPPHDSTLIGWSGVEDGKTILYLRLSPCLSLARDYWQRVGEGLDTTPDALQREIFQAGLLHKREEPAYTVSTWIASESKTTRALAIDVEKVTKFAGVDVLSNDVSGGDK